jgi:hypothetical protein
MFTYGIIIIIIICSAGDWIQVLMFAGPQTWDYLLSSSI